MGHTAVYIHEDDEANTQMSAKRRVMTVEDRGQPFSDEKDDVVSNPETMSEIGEDDEEEVDESVAEDMRKLEESFKGISQKYRLINRIGEGQKAAF